MKGSTEHAPASLRFASAPGRPLALGAQGPVSLGRFRADVEQLADRLPADGDVLVTCDSRYAFGVALLAAWLASRAAILPPNRLAASRADIRRRFPVAFECDDRWAAGLGAQPDVDDDGEWRVELAPAQTAVRLFTSGSTGTPRMIPKSVGNLLDEARTLRAGFDWPAAPVAATVPAQHLYGLTFSLLLPWVLGVPWVDATPLYPQDIADLVAASGAGTLISVPVQYRALLQERPGFGHLHCVSAAAVLDADTARRWRRQQGRDILEIYGSTETGVVGHRRQLEDSAWHAFDPVDLSVSGDGLLQVDSPFVSDAWNGSFCSADRVELLDARRFRLFGRADSIVKIGGKRVSLAAIEHTLAACEGVTDAAVLAVANDGLVRDKVIWAAIAVEDRARFPLAALRRRLRSELDGIEVPKRLLLLDRLPRTASGKLPREALERLFRDPEQARV